MRKKKKPMERASFEQDQIMEEENVTLAQLSKSPRRPKLKPSFSSSSSSQVSLSIVASF